MAQVKSATLRCVAKSINTVAMLGCIVFFIGALPALGQSTDDTKASDREIIEQQRVEKTIPGTLHYESSYEMTKDDKGNFHSTYESQKNEWFCCLNWFSSEEKETSTTEKS